ncbi:hypothetical protein AX16_005418 [Volvariella volvacea WC 439]|nr:hypothetical protein AX16_005418 [Volvariella volvacea WC 439]
MDGNKTIKRGAILPVTPTPAPDYPDHDDALPSYQEITSSRTCEPTTEHVFTLDNPKGKACLTLPLKSYAKSSHSSPPVYTTGSRVTGDVQLELDHWESIKSVVIMVVGTKTLVGREPRCILKMEKTLWNAKQGDHLPVAGASPPSSPTDPSAQDGSVSALPPSASASGAPGRNTTHNMLGSKVQKVWNPNTVSMSGAFQLPFEFDGLPTEVELSDVPHHYPKWYPLLPHITERPSLVHLGYKVEVFVKKVWYDMPAKLTAILVYLPLETARLPSLLSQLAYGENQQALFGPDVDPEGWKVLPSVSFKGKLFNAQDVEHSSIPYLRYRQTNPAALAYDASCFYLVRVTIVGPSALSYPLGDEQQQQKRKELGEANTLFKSLDQAYFWYEKGNEDNAKGSGTENGSRSEMDAKKFRRVLHGKIMLAKNIKPSFIFPGITVMVSDGYFIDIGYYKM